MECPVAWLVTCEHGGNNVPLDFADLFDTEHARRCLHSHRGHDPGALIVANQIAEHLKVPLIASTTTRLLVDLNRSEAKPNWLSEFSRKVDRSRRKTILQTHYRPYRKRVFNRIESAIDDGRRVVHLSIHTFAARFRGQVRAIDVGLLFDPSRDLERRFCESWMDAMRTTNPRRRVLANQPYAGTDDGLTTTCRDCFAADKYLGIEIEISQRYARRTQSGLRKVGEELIESMPASS